MSVETYFYWPLFEALLTSPEAKGLFVGGSFVLLVVSTCVFCCAIGTLLIGVRR